jgi:hypothetical protein
MDELIRVFLYQGATVQRDVEIPRAEFERALDALFADDATDVVLRIGDREVRGVTDLILAGAEQDAQETLKPEHSADLMATDAFDEDSYDLAA